MFNPIQKTIFLLLLFVCQLAAAQPRQSYVFSRIGKVNGLAADAALGITQDKQGYLWVGTENGLQRYDGKRFVTFRHNPADANTIPANRIDGVFCDSKDRIWLRMRGALMGYMDPKTFQYHAVKYTIPDSLRNNMAFEFTEDGGGNISVSVFKYGVVTYNPAANEFAARYNVVQLPGGKIPTGIVQDGKSKRYWVSHVGGFDEYDLQTRQLLHRLNNGVTQKISGLLTRYKAFGPGFTFTDKQGRFWSYYWFNAPPFGPELLSYNTKNGEWQSFANNLTSITTGYYAIGNILHQRNGNIWVYGTNMLAKLNEQTLQFEDARNESLRLNGIDLQVIYQLFEDREQNIWMASDNGLFMFNPGNQIFSNIAQNRNDGKTYTHAAEAILQTKDGKIYASAWGAGIFVYDSNLNVLPNPIIPSAKANDGVSVWDMLERENGEIWMAMQGGYLRIYNQHTGKSDLLKLPVFENHTVRQVLEDRNGQIWLGTQSGLIIRCDAKNWRDTAHAFKLIKNARGNIAKLVEDSKGFIWACTENYGLFKLNATSGAVLEFYSDASPADSRLAQPGAYDILEHNDSIMLIAGNGIQVLNTNTKKISYITTDDGLPPSDVMSLTKDKLGYVWAGMHSGVCRLWIGENYVNTFGLEDGISNNHCQPNAATLLRDGRMLMGTTTNLLLFNPAQVKINRNAVPIYIAGFKVHDQPLRVDSLLQLNKVSLPYNNNSITIDFTTHTFSMLYGVTYMLEGVDKDWKISSSRQAIYSYLAPGTYVLKAKATRSERNEPDKVITLVIEIVPPVWNRWWFYGLIILSAFGIFYLADKDRLMRIKATEKLRADIALNLHHDVSVALNNINLLSEMARMKADKDIGKAKDLIEQISNKSNKMIISMDDMLWSIDPANDSMEMMFLRMTEFADALRHRHEANITIQIDKKVSKMKVDMKLRLGFFLVYKEALRAIIQHSGGRKTLVNVDRSKGSLCLKMHDDTPLDLSEENVLKSMEEMKALARNMKAELDIQYDKHGSNIVLLLPDTERRDF